MKRHPERSEGPAFSCTLNNIEAPKKRQPLKNARACFKNGVRPNSRSFVAAKTGPLLRMTPFLKHALANLAGKLPSYRVFMVLNPLKGTPVRANGDVELE
jgi:hypothetical protein